MTFLSGPVAMSALQTDTTPGSSEVGNVRDAGRCVIMIQASRISFPGDEPCSYKRKLFLQSRIFAASKRQHSQGLTPAHTTCRLMPCPFLWLPCFGLRML